MARSLEPRLVARVESTRPDATRVNAHELRGAIKELRWVGQRPSGLRSNGGTVTRYDPHVEWYETFRPSLNDDEADALRRMLGSGPGRCLDIGCGTGVAIPELARLGWTVVGVDVSDEMLSRARAFGAELHQAPGDALPFDDASRSGLDLDAYGRRGFPGDPG